MEAQPEETSPMLKDHPAIREVTHASNVDNKGILPTTALRGNDATTTTPISSILMTMTKNIMTTTLRSNQSTLLTTLRPDLLTSLEMTKPN